MMKRTIEERMQVGDVWTLIEDQPVLNEQTGEPVGPNDLISKWLNTGEPGRVFKVMRVHSPSAYEVEFIGFMDVRHDADGTLSVELVEEFD